MIGRAAAALLVVLAVAACGDERAEESVASQPVRSVVGWEQLPTPPLSGRTGAVAAWTGEEVVVVGGWTYLCPPAADCPSPEEPPFRDGAAFSMNDYEWRAIAPAPVGVVHGSPAVVDRDVFLLSGQDVVRYRPETDTWDALPPLPSAGGFRLVAIDTPAGAALIAAASSDEQGEEPDLRLDLTPSTASGWTPLPDDPLPPSYDRHLVAVGDQLLLFAKPLPDGDNSELPRVHAAALDEGASEWRLLPEAPGSGYQAWPVDGRVVLNPHFGRAAAGGVFEVDSATWSPLPDPPGASTWRGDMAGVIGTDSGFFEYTSGWVLDLATERWLEVSTREGAATGDDFNVARAAVGRRLFTFGGARWEDGTEGRLLDEAWLWSPPEAGGG